MGLGLRTLALSLVILVFTVSIGAKTTNTAYENFRNTSAACTDDNASTTCVETGAGDISYTGTSALGDFADWFSIIVISGVGGAVLNLLMSSFSGLGGNNQAGKRM